MPLEAETPVNPEAPVDNTPIEEPETFYPSDFNSPEEPRVQENKGYGGASDNTEVNVNVGQQNKHIPGTNEYKNSGSNRSVVDGNINDVQQLLDDFAGTGEKIGSNKERVDFGKVIGQYVNPETGVGVDTTKGIIHYGKKGAHIVPAKP